MLESQGVRFRLPIIRNSEPISVIAAARPRKASGVIMIFPAFVELKGLLRCLGLPGPNLHRLSRLLFSILGQSL